MGEIETVDCRSFPTPGPGWARRGGPGARGGHQPGLLSWGNGLLCGWPTRPKGSCRPQHSPGEPPVPFSWQNRHRAISCPSEPWPGILTGYTGREQKGNTSGSVWPWGLPLACLGWQPLHGGSSDSLVPLTPSPGTKTETRSRRPCGLGLGPRVARTELTCSWSAAVRSVCTGGAWRCPGPGASADSRLLPSLGPLLPASAWTAPP